MRKLLKVLSLFLILILCIHTETIAYATNKYVWKVETDKEYNISGSIFILGQYQINSSYEYANKIIMIKNGKQTVVAKKVSSGILTNGEILYYSQHKQKLNDYQYLNTIYRYNIKTGKKEKMITGTDYTVCNSSGKYLYCGTDNGPDGVDLYALNVHTKKKKHMVDVVGGVYISKSKVITSTNTGDVGNYPINSFDLDGTGRKKITDGILLKVQNGKIYYCKYKYKDMSDKFKVYSCSLLGKNKKVLTGWLNSFPQNYYM